MTLQDLFVKIDAFVTAAEQKAADAADQGSATLRAWADWIDAQKAGLKFAAAEDCATAGSLLARCKACCPDKCDPKQPKAAGGLLVGLLIQVLTTFLESLLKNQQP